MFPYLFSATHSLTGKSSWIQTKEAQEEDSGVRKTRMEAVCLSAATLCRETRCIELLYRCILQRQLVLSQAHRGGGVLLSH
jgi:hypothetical protein